MTSKKINISVYGYKRPELISTFRDVISKYAGDDVGQISDLSFIVGSLTDFATWCTEPQYLKYNPVDLLIDLNIPTDEAISVYNSVLDEVSKLLNTAMDITNSKRILEARINASGFLTVIMEGK